MQNKSNTHVHEFKGHVGRDVDTLSEAVAGLAAFTLTHKLGSFLPVDLTTSGSVQMVVCKNYIIIFSFSMAPFQQYRTSWRCTVEL